MKEEGGNAVAYRHKKGNPAQLGKPSNAADSKKRDQHTEWERHTNPNGAHEPRAPGATAKQTQQKGVEERSGHKAGGKGNEGSNQLNSQRLAEVSGRTLNIAKYYSKNLKDGEGEIAIEEILSRRLSNDLEGPLTRDDVMQAVYAKEQFAVTNKRGKVRIAAAASTGATSKDTPCKRRRREPRRDNEHSNGWGKQKTQPCDWADGQRKEESSPESEWDADSDST